MLTNIHTCTPCLILIHTCIHMCIYMWEYTASRHHKRCLDDLFSYMHTYIYWLIFIHICICVDAFMCVWIFFRMCIIHIHTFCRPFTCSAHTYMLQCVAVCFRVLQCVSVCCRVLQCVAVCCSVLQCVAAHTRTSCRPLTCSVHTSFNFVTDSSFIFVMSESSFWMPSAA